MAQPENQMLVEGFTIVWWQLFCHYVLMKFQQCTTHCIIDDIMKQSIMVDTVDFVSYCKTAMCRL